MSAFSRFSKSRNELSSAEPISDEELRKFAPSIFKESAYSGMSDKYTFVPTFKVHAAMTAEGYRPHRVVQQRARLTDRSPEGIALAAARTEFKKHMILYRHPDGNAVAKGGCGEVGFVGSHDGGCSVFMFSGWLEFLCANGLVIGCIGKSVSIPHKGDIIAQVLAEAANIIASLGPIANWRNELMMLEMNHDAMMEFAREALALRYGDTEAPIKPHQLLEGRRVGDTTRNLWGVYQVVEENLRRGGLFPYATMERHQVEGRGNDGRRRPLRRTGGVAAIDGTIKLETKLSELTETWRQRLAA